MPHYEMYLIPEDREMAYLKSIEIKAEIGGVLLGPLWLIYMKGSILLVLMVVVLMLGPVAIFGANAATISWALLVWLSNAWGRLGLSAILLRKMGYARVGWISAPSRTEAELRFKKENLCYERVIDSAVARLQSVEDSDSSKKKSFGDSIAERDKKCAVLAKRESNADRNLILVGELESGKAYIDADSVKALGRSVVTRVIYTFPRGVCDANSVSEKHTQEEYDLIEEKFRVHETLFIYGDGSVRESLSQSKGWSSADESHEKVLSRLRNHINKVIG